MRQPLHKGLLFFSLCAFLSSCSGKPSAAPQLKGEDAFRYVSEIYALGPKPSGSEGAKKAAAHIQKAISTIGLESEVDEWKDLNGAGTETVYRNISTTIPGKSRRFIVIGSHYDSKKLETVPEFAGANDGASSSGLLLSAIKSIKNSADKPPFTLIFVFFDGEECLISYSGKDGLAGSRRFASRMKEKGIIPDCKSMILMDMVGDKDLRISIPSNSTPELSAKALAIADRRGWKAFFTSGKTAMLDDHVPFLELGIPAIDIIDFEYGENNRYWHTAGDTIDKISPVSLEITGNMLLELLFCLE